MALRFHFFSLKLLRQSQTNPFLFTASTIKFRNFNSKQPKKLQISCADESVSDEILAEELGFEIRKIKTQIAQREEALNKSKELLFTELCNFLGIKSEDLMKKWKRMSEEDKWVLVKEFVSKWSANFHPLSPKSVKEMVDEHLVQDNSVSSAFSANFLPGFRRFMGFPQV